MRKRICIAAWTVLLALSQVDASWAEPTVLAGSDLPGRQVRLGDSGRRGVEVPEGGLVVPLPVPLGRVMIEAELRSNGAGDALRQRTVALAVGDATSTATIAALDGGMVLRIALVNREPKADLRFSLGRLTVAMETERRVLEARDAGMGKAPAGTSELAAAPDGEPLLDGLLGELDAGPVLDVGERKMPVVILEQVRVLPRSGPVVVRRVASNRITCAPGAEGTLTVELENLAAAAQDVQLTVAMIAGLDERQPLATETLTLPPGGTATREVGFAVGQALWGRGFEAVAATAGGTDVGTHAVSVVDNPWMVAMHGRGWGIGHREPTTREEAVAAAEDIAQRNLAAYANVYEAFAWAPCDYSEMTPDTDAEFFSGQTQYYNRRGNLQALHAALRRHGIAAITYGKACGGGFPGLEFSHAYPERMNIFGHAGFAHESFDVDVIDRMLEGRYRKFPRDEDFWAMWISCWTHYGNHAATFYGCDEIAASAKLLGWDGVRYDGEWQVWNNPALSASLVKVTEEHIRKQVPGFVFGYNTIGPRYRERAGAFTDVSVAAKARGGGMCMDEYYRNLPGPAKGNITHLQNAGDFIRLHGGYYLCIFDDNTPWNEALIFAAGGRTMGGGSAGLRKFATRYAQYILDPALRRILDPARFIKPPREVPFRWDAFVYERVVSPTRHQLILHLVNVNDATTFGSQYSPPTHLNPPQADIGFDLALPPGCRAAGVFAAGNLGDLKPMPARIEGARVTVPELDVWTLVVIDLERDGEAPPLHALCPEPDLVLDKVYDDSSPRSRPGGAVPEVTIGDKLDDAGIEAINDCRVRITPAVLDQVLALGKPADTAPGDDLFKGFSFDKHRTGRDAGWDAAPTQPLPPVRDGRPDVLHARGGFAHRNRLEEAFARIGGAAVVDAAVRNISALADLSAKNPGCVLPWPERTELARHDVVVLDAVPAPALSLSQRRDLRDFVTGGGGLFALGSWYSLSKGQYEGSFIEEALPARTRQAAYLRRVRPADGGLVATDAYARVLGEAPPAFGDGPAVEWLSHIEPRPGAEVLMTTAEGVPVLVAGACGEGRSVVWAASASGLPAAPWWESPWWPEVAAACLRYLARGAEALSPPDETLARRLAEARALVEDASLMALLDGGLDKQPDANGEAEVAARLRTLLRGGADADARAAVAHLLENPERVEPALYPELTALALPRLAPTPEWAALATRFVKAPPHLLDDLVAELAAVALPGVKVEEVMGWKVSDIVRLRCLAAVGDPAALPYLRTRSDELDAQEEKWAAADNAFVSDLYATRLLRPYVAWALWRCGQRDAETAHRFAKACLDVPYYHWRQHWVLANRQAAAVEAQRAGGTGTESRAGIMACERAIRDLARAARHSEAWFTPEQIGTTPEARRAVARALADADSRKSLPLALAYLRATPDEHLPDFAALATARLDSLRHLYAARQRQARANGKTGSVPEQQGGQHADDGDHDQEFHEGERPARRPRVAGWPPLFHARPSRFRPGPAAPRSSVESR